MNTGEMTLMEMEKISNFYFEDLCDMLDEEGNFIIPESSFHKLRHDEVPPLDFDSISKFGKIVKNYLRIQRLLNVE